MRSSAPRAAGSSRPTPTSPISTRPTRAATSRPGRSRRSSRKRSGPRSAHCADHRAWSSRTMSLFSKQRTAGTLPVEARLPGFDGATGWLNSAPLTPDGLRGKVVLVDFWTYTCINWLRTLGYVRAWAARYDDQGLVVIGVHTPEFPFEKDEDNVRWAASDMDVTYPVALDPDYAVWSAFANRYWPAVYIADAEGRIRHHHFGEGGYEECERVVQQLLRDAGSDGIGDDVVSV